MVNLVETRDSIFENIAEWSLRKPQASQVQFFGYRVHFQAEVVELCLGKLNLTIRELFCYLEAKRAQKLLPQGEGVDFAIRFQSGEFLLNVE